MQENEQTNVRTKQVYCTWCAQAVLRNRIDTEDENGYVKSYHRHCYKAYLSRW